MLTDERKTFYAFNIDKMFKTIFGADNEKGKKNNIELNSSFNDVTRIRNLNYYFAFCS